MMESEPPVDPESLGVEDTEEDNRKEESLLPADSFTIQSAFRRSSVDEPVSLTAEQLERKSLLDRCLAVYYTRQVDADVLRPWSIMHGLIGFGEETLVIYRGKRLNAIEYLCSNGVGDDRRILYVSNGMLKTRVGPGVQGHEAQLLAMLAQSNVPSDQKLTVEGTEFTVQDLIDYEMKTCRSDAELTFKLLGLSHYLDTEHTWENNDGQQWDLARLLKEELAQPVNDGACGGTHRLMALSYAVAMRRQEDKPIDGHWYRADKFIRDFQEYTWSHQHKNGGFSTDWFRSRKFESDPEKSLYTTGHVLEWLVFSLPEDQLDDPRLAKSVDYVLNLMMSAPNYDLPVGPRGHALRALRIYQQKVFEKSDYARLMNDARLVNNNPQNGGGASKARTTGSTQPTGWRRARFGRRR